MSNLLPSTLHGIPPERVEQMLAQRQDLMRYLAYLVDLVGGEMEIPIPELLKDRVLQKEEIRARGVIRLTVEKP